MSEKSSTTEAPTQMVVRKRNGNLEPIDINKIIRAVARCAVGIPEVDPNRVAIKTIGGLYNGATTQELDDLSIKTASSLIAENPNYSLLAGAMLAEILRKEVVLQGIESFSQSIAKAYELKLVPAGVNDFVQTNARKLNNAVDDGFNAGFTYFGLKSVQDKYLLRDESTSKVIETPQYMLMRSAVLARPTAKAVIQLYRQLAKDVLTPGGGVQNLFIRRAEEFKESAVPVQLDVVVNYRPLKPGMGQAVAERTVLRRKANGEWETWGDVADRVAFGNALLKSTPKYPFESEYATLRKFIAAGGTLMSGRHLQHGDKDQPKRNMEVFTNCSTSAASFLTFYFLLNGSGVGRGYDDDMMLVNWDNAPNIRCVLDSAHPNYVWGAHESVRDARHKYGSPTDAQYFNVPSPKEGKSLTGEEWKQATEEWEARVIAAGGRPGAVKKAGPNVLWFQVPDSREGWSKALEFWEVLAFEKIHKDTILILDFSAVRPEGMPIGGMQKRPASGPVPLMNAFMKASSLKGANLAPWKQTIYIDHYFAECVLVGGARRAARMSTKTWRDPGVQDFISVKRPIEYDGLTLDEIIALRKGPGKPNSFLWSSNNSVAVDAEFWKLVRLDTAPEFQKPLERHAKAVFRKVCEAAFADGTGEPGFINVDKLVQNDEGWKDLGRGDFAGSDKYQISDDTTILLSKLAKRAKGKPFHMIVNPCGEIVLNILGGFCVIADVVPFHCETLDDAEECFRAVTRALIRVNLMNSMYGKEVKRTNRIGVGLTGVHEFAWKFFKFGFRDLIDEQKSKAFWLTMARFNRAVADEARKYAKELGVAVPHTMTTIKPAGTTSKLFGLTEGWHLPAMAYYLRWVQFRSDDPQIEQYRNNGYPVRDLQSYQGTTIVGFPTSPIITELGMGDKLVTAGEATPEEQFQWLKLGEKYWINGTDEEGNPLTESYGNQISYTLKYDPASMTFDEFQAMILEHQSQVRCCSVMPLEDQSSYEYLPEEPVSFERFAEIQRNLEQSLWKKSEVTEEIGREHVGCDNGACPIDFNSGAKA